MKFVCRTLTSIARRFFRPGPGLTFRAASSAGPSPLAGLPLSEPAETVVTAGTEGVAAGGLPEAQGDTAIHSRYAGNIRLSPIVRKFAARLHEQLVLADTARCSGDVEALARFGHWLAGAAGTVGYDAFTGPARELELRARQGDAQAAATALRRLARMANQLVVPDALATS